MNWEEQLRHTIISIGIVLVIFVACGMAMLFPLDKFMHYRYRQNAIKEPHKHDICFECGIMHPHKLMTPYKNGYVCFPMCEEPTYRNHGSAL